jgi:hypothetical protein
MSWMQHNYNEKKHYLYTPIHIEKYRGKTVPVVLRSKLEYKFAVWCDRTKSVLLWECEPIAIPYFNPVKNRKARYFPDFVMRVKTDKGEKTFVIEIKHESGVIKPKATGKKALLYEQATYLVNQAKWKSCLRFCNKYNYEFKIITNKFLDTLR